ncbi:MAG: zincin-like metallopeptidase domain-containing protein [Ferruginibacter sp.]
MDSHTTSSTPIDVYQLVTDQIIALLEKGVVPWQKSWNEAGLPMNLLSKRHYRGINLWLLLSLNYERNFFLTWDQVKSIGGSVLKNEKGQIIAFWKHVPKKPVELDEKGEPKTTAMLRYYRVFNIDQCRDIRPELIPTIGAPLNFNPIASCETIIVKMPNCPPIQHKEQQAYYNPEKDFINMPKKKSFKLAESYYSTLFHELIHATGSEKRLARKTLGEMSSFGSENYSMEELIAEIGSAFLCHSSGILPNQIDNTAAYLDNWLGVFKNDKRFIVTASGQAQKASDLILNIPEKESKEEVNEAISESVIS